MTEKEKILYELIPNPAPIIEKALSDRGFTKIDLSNQNQDLASYDITAPHQCQSFIDAFQRKHSGKTAFGGYLETRNLYSKYPNFRPGGQEVRNIHLGLDIWAAAGTAVLAPLDGLLHSWADNSDTGNYGPTIILEHSTPNFTFYTLYGHLSRASLKGLKERQPISSCEKFAEFGKIGENGGYAPHLHFQVIFDLQGYRGDYPGVCGKSTLEFYQKNCPDPNLLLKL